MLNLLLNLILNFISNIRKGTNNYKLILINNTNLNS